MAIPELTRRDVVKYLTKKSVIALLATSNVTLLSKSDDQSESQKKLAYTIESEPRDFPLDKHFITKAATEIREHGFYRENFSATTVEELMRAVGQKELVKNRFHGATITSTQVEISENVATIHGSIQISLFGTIDLSATLTQESRKEPTLTSLEITGSNFMVNELLQKVQATTRAEKKLSCLYKTIQDYLNENMAGDNITITGITLDFLPNNKIEVYVEGLSA